MSTTQISVHASATVQTLPEQAIRSGSRFLVKPMYEGKSYRCYESGFHATCHDSIRVHRLEDMRLGLQDFTSDEFYDLKGKQPIFFLQEKFSEEHVGYDWNGLLLYRLPGDKKLLREIVREHQKELHIVLAFDEPDCDLYYVLIDTGLDGGTPEEFGKWQQDILDMQLQPLFHKPHGLPLATYSRALTPEHYDIVDQNVLFSLPMETEEEPSGQPMTAGEVLKHLFKHLTSK